MAMKAVALSVGMMPTTSPVPIPATRNGASGFMAISPRREFSIIAFDDAGQFTADRVGQFAGEGRAFDEELDLAALHFGIGVDADDGLFVVGNDDRLLLVGIGGRGRDVAHELLDFGLDGGGIQIADDHYGLIVGAIPLVVEVFQAVEISDQVSVFVLGVAADGLDELHRGAPRSAVARTQLLHDDAAFGVDLIGLQGDEVRPVVEDQQGRIDDTLTRGGDILDVVDGLIPAGSGVEVGAELHADGFEIRRKLFSGEVFGTVEGHVFEEVGEALLGVVFLDGADVVDDVEIGLTLWFFVVADVVGHAVFEFTRAEFGIGRNRLIHLRGGAAYGECRQGHQKQSLHVKRMVKSLYLFGLLFVA